MTSIKFLSETKNVTSEELIPASFSSFTLMFVPFLTFYQSFTQRFTISNRLQYIRINWIKIQLTLQFKNMSHLKSIDKVLPRQQFLPDTPQSLTGSRSFNDSHVLTVWWKLLNGFGLWNTHKE